MASRIRNVRLSPIALAVITALTAPMAFSQSADQEVVVSGSRIKRDNYSTAAPVQIIRNEDSVLAGFSSTTEVLQGTAVTGGQSQINNAYGGYVTEGGPGANTLGLRGFGPTRSLILLNGRRMAPSGTRGAVGAADLNTLPSSIIDRIEVLKDGASSIYGSDAVAGVVNIITKTNLTGVSASLNQTGTEHGGGNTTNFSLAGGFVSDKTRFSGSFNHTKRTDLTLGDRDWTSCNTDYRRKLVDGVMGDWGNADYIDPATGKIKCYPITSTGSNGVTVNTLGTASIAGVAAAGAFGPTFNRWRPNAAVTTGLPGYEGLTGTNAANNVNNRTTFEPRMLNSSLISPVVNNNFFGQGAVDLDVLGDAQLYYEFLMNRRESSQVGYRQLSLDYMYGSPLLPANLRNSLFAFPTVISNGQYVAARGFIGFGNYNNEQTVDFSRAVVGLRGAIGKSGWDYDVVAVRSESKGTYMSENFLTDRMAKSLDVVASGTGFVCRDATGGCVAAPALSPAVIGGQLPADWAKYVFQPVTGMTKFKEDVVTATATGTLFSVPAGKVRAAFGVEVRNNSIDDTPSIESQTNNLYGFTSSAATRGSDSAKDVFAEVEVPLLKNVPGARELILNGSTRWADYRSYGSASTYKLGALWSIEKSLSVRATSGTSYRAPALYEQFMGATTGFTGGTNDPCNAWDSAGKAGSIRSTNCQSEGLPAGYDNKGSITVVNSGGAAAGLKAETSKNLTVGVIFQPELPSGMGDLSLAMDRFAITVKDGVSRVGSSSILARCYDNPGFRSAGGFCRLVTRTPGSNALTVSDSYINLATDMVKGYDFTARYATNVSDGKLRVNMNATRYDNQSNKLFETDPLVDYNGMLTNPNWTANLDVNYTSKDWTYFYGLNWVGSSDSYTYFGLDPATSGYKFHTPDYFTHNVSVKYKNPVQKWDLVVGIRNLTDVKPPMVSSGSYNRIGNALLYSGYDFIGRTLFVNLNKSF
jgi:outer membrane receptor protein involved in Fe transport